jgi:hypothetical protein
MAPSLARTDTAILARAIDPSQGNLTEAAARSILDIHLTDSDCKRRDELADKARQGTLSPEDLSELDNYRHVGRILEMMKAKARVSLKKRERAS